MPTCPNGHAVDADVAFCRQCGASLAPARPLYADETAVAPVPPAPAPAAHVRPAAQSNTAVYVLAGVIVLIGLVGIGLALVLGSNDNSGRPTPVAQSPSGSPTGQTPQGSATPSPTAFPAGGTQCPGTVQGGGTFGTIGSETSCGFVQAVYRSYLDTAGLNQSQGQTTTVSAKSPATHRTYDNIVCTAGSPWVTCVGGNDNTARMFFAHP